MCQLKDIQILYAIHFDSLPKNDHETRAGFLPRSLEFRNVEMTSTGLGQPVFYCC
jgi:hypothetical protein